VLGLEVRGSVPSLYIGAPDAGHGSPDATAARITAEIPRSRSVAVTAPRRRDRAVSPRPHRFAVTAQRRRDHTASSRPHRVAVTAQRRRDRTASP
jgi:hypothetical protein